VVGLGGGGGGGWEEGVSAQNPYPILNQI